MIDSEDRDSKETQSEGIIDLNDYESALLFGYIRSLYFTSKEIDKFGTWLLAGIGAAAILIIANLESISKSINYEYIGLALCLLCISGLFGVLQKYLAFEFSVLISQEIKLKEHLSEIEKENIKKTNINKVLRAYADLHPWFAKRALNKQNSQRARMSCYFRQEIYVMLELIFFMVFIGLMTFAVLRINP